MKKLLSLLSVLTITGTSFPTVVAASDYKRNEFERIQEINQQETLNSGINYQNKTNLKELNFEKKDKLLYFIFKYFYSDICLDSVQKSWNYIEEQIKKINFKKAGYQAIVGCVSSSTSKAIGEMFYKSKLNKILLGSGVACISGGAGMFIKSVGEDINNVLQYVDFII